MNIQVGDVIFIRGHTPIISWLIKLFDHGKFSHVCLFVSKTGEILEADIFMKSHIVPFKYKDYEVIRLNLTQEQINMIPTISLKYLNINYDYKLIFWYSIKDFFNLKKPWNSPKSMICSEIVNLILYEIGAISEGIYMKVESPNRMYERMKTE